MAFDVVGCHRNRTALALAYVCPERRTMQFGFRDVDDVLTAKQVRKVHM